VYNTYNNVEKKLENNIDKVGGRAEKLKKSPLFKCFIMFTKKEAKKKKK
jgi:hypothetical protein